MRVKTSDVNKTQESLKGTPTNLFLLSSESGHDTAGKKQKGHTRVRRGECKSRRKILGEKVVCDNRIKADEPFPDSVENPNLFWFCFGKMSAHRLFFKNKKKTPKNEASYSFTVCKKVQRNPSLTISKKRMADILWGEEWIFAVSIPGREEKILLKGETRLTTKAQTQGQCKRHNAAMRVQRLFCAAWDGSLREV